MRWDNRLLQLQENIAQIYKILPVDGVSAYEECDDRTVIKRAVFMSFLTHPTEVPDSVEQAEIDKDAHCTEMYDTIRKAFPLNTILVWRKRPEFGYDEPVGHDDLGPATMHLRLRIGELK